MRYRGQIRFPDVDTGDLDVSLEVDDTHVRILAGGKSLGRWCLADVVADRLLANEFELDLDGEVVRFLAEDQINFAYGAVQAMAEGWARYQAMNFVKRSRAVASARKDTEPSRLRDAHQAFVMAREALGEEEANLIREAVEEPIEAEEKAATEKPGRFRRRHLAAPETEGTSVADADQPVEEPQPLEEGEPRLPEEPDPTPAAPHHAGPPHVALPYVAPPHVAPPYMAPSGDRAASPAPPPVDEESSSARPTLSERLARARADAETAAEHRPSDPAVLSRKVPRIDTFPGRGSTGSGKPAEADGSTPAPPPAPENEPDMTGETASRADRRPLPAREPESEPEPERPPQSNGEAGEETRPVDEVEPSVEPEPAVPEAPTEQEEPVPVTMPSTTEPAVRTSTAATENGPPGTDATQAGAYADGHHPAETSGLRASLRSVFSRSKAEPHEHSFVESTTAVGLTRKVCIECGHVSIGVSD